MITDRHIPQLSFSQQGRRFSYFITPQFHNQQLQDVQKVVLTISKLMLNSEIPIKHGALFLHQNMFLGQNLYSVSLWAYNQTGSFLCNTSQLKSLSPDLLTELLPTCLLYLFQVHIACQTISGIVSYVFWQLMSWHSGLFFWQYTGSESSPFSTAIDFLLPCV